MTHFDWISVYVLIKYKTGFFFAVFHQSCSCVLYHLYFLLLPILNINSTNTFHHEFQINVAERTRNITLHSKNLNITTNGIRINALSSKDKKCNPKLSVKSTEILAEHDFFMIHTNEILEERCRFEITIPFGSDLDTGLLGYYRSSYMDRQTKEKRYSNEIITHNNNFNIFFFFKCNMLNPCNQLALCYTVWRWELNFSFGFAFTNYDNWFGIVPF